MTHYGDEEDYITAIRRRNRLLERRILRNQVRIIELGWNAAQRLTHKNTPAN
jgi:hypothetical protein